MTDEKLELLTIRSRHSRVGIDSAEIERVLTGIDEAKRQSPMIREYQAQGRFHLWTGESAA